MTVIGKANKPRDQNKTNIRKGIKSQTPRVEMLIKMLNIIIKQEKKENLILELWGLWTSEMECPSAPGSLDS